ncbi:leucine-rich repeat protein [Clostridia bacterium]|nr:leucine-rich repeat protein [Clostridia bacterium]
MKGLYSRVSVRKMVLVTLTVVLLLFGFQTSAMAEEVFSYDNFQYLDNGDGTCEIIGYIGTPASPVLGYLSIPDQLNGLVVTSIGAEAFLNSGITRIISIPETVTRMGKDAFSGNSITSSITLWQPEGTYDWYSSEGKIFSEVIDDFGLSYVARTKDEYTLTDSDVTVSDGILTSYTTSNTGYDYPEYPPAFIAIPETLDGQTIVSIGDEAFKESLIRSVTMPDSVTSIGNSAFYGNRYLDQLELSPNLTSIGDSAFYKCYLTEPVTLGENLKVIGDNAFEWNFFRTLSIPDSVTSMGFAAFRFNVYLNSLTLGSGLTEIGRDAFRGASLTEVIGGGTNEGIIFGRNADGSVDESSVIGYGGRSTTIDFIPSSVRYIGTSAFGNSVAESVIIPDSVETIGSGAFSDCQIESVEIGKNVMTIGSRAFSSNFIQSVEFGDNVTSIGEWAFSDNSLESATFGENLADIGMYAFYDNSLQTVEMGDNVKSIGQYAFAGNSLESVKLGTGLTSLGRAAFNQNSISSVIGGGTDDGIFFGINSDGSEDYSTIVSYGGASKSIDFIPDSVENIGRDAFSYSDLTSVTIPDGVKTLGIAAFRGNSLASIELPDSIIQIEISAFLENEMSSFILPTPEGIIDWYRRYDRPHLLESGSVQTDFMEDYFARIGNYTLTDDDVTVVDGLITECSIEVIQSSFPPNNVGLEYPPASIVIPEMLDGQTVTGIGEGAFVNQYLTSISIPESVTVIGARAFAQNVLSSFTLPECRVDGYAFIEWVDGSSNSYLGNSDATNLTTSYVAVLSDSAYPIYYVLDGGVNYEDAPTYYNEETETLVLGTPNKDYYTFSGWFDASFGGKQVTEIQEGSTGDVTLYARWTPIAYPVIYDLNGGMNYEDAPVSYNIETEDIILGTPSKTGYDFTGWFDAVTDGNQVTEISQGSTGEVTLYARWSLATYDITYTLNGGANYEDAPTSYTMESETLVLGTPDKDYYTFAGWFDASSGGNQVTEIQEGSTGDVTLYARWTPIAYPVTYDLSGGLNYEGAPVSYNIETKDIALGTPTKMGYDFAGWYDAATDGNQVTEIPQGSTGEVNLYARWALATYDITYNLNGGLNYEDAPQSYTVESETLVLGIPTKNNYKFIGWYDTESDIWITEIPQGTFGDKVLIAKWSRRSSSSDSDDSKPDDESDVLPLLDIKENDSSGSSSVMLVTFGHGLTESITPLPWFEVAMLLSISNDTITTDMDAFMTMLNSSDIYLLEGRGVQLILIHEDHPLSQSVQDYTSNHIDELMEILVVNQ